MEEIDKMKENNKIIYKKKDEKNEKKNDGNERMKHINKIIYKKKQREKIKK